MARTLRILALTPGSSLWTVWLDGYRETLELLEADDNDAALERYRQIFIEYRACVENLPL